ncbi:MAG: molybdopterin-dependent oxidoreductase, partial [Gammaproteobacteria bacterium]
DRDRFSYEGIYSADRAVKPLIRENGVLREVSWDVALEAAAKALQETVGNGSAQDVGAWLTSAATVEEAYLLSRLMRGLGSENIDSRSRQSDFRASANDPVYPQLGVEIEAIEQLDAALVVGSALRQEAPILAHRVRKAALAGASVNFLNISDEDYLFPVSEQIVVPRDGLLNELGALLQAAGAALPQGVTATSDADERHQAVVAALKNAEKSVVWIGQVVEAHEERAQLLQLAAALAKATGASLGMITAGPNAAGVAIAGAVPHRTAYGGNVEPAGMSLAEMCDKPRRTLLLFGMEPELDCANGAAATAAVSAAETVIALTPWVSGVVEGQADIVLPVGCFAETSGTFVNAAGLWQSFAGVSMPVGESRPGWKVLRVLGNLLGFDGFEYTSSEAVRDELQGDFVPASQPVAEQIGSAPIDSAIAADFRPVLQLPMYSIDPLVRRASALQLTREAQGKSQEVA